VSDIETEAGFSPCLPAEAAGPRHGSAVADRASGTGNPPDPVPLATLTGSLSAFMMRGPDGAWLLCVAGIAAEPLAVTVPFARGLVGVLAPLIAAHDSYAGVTD
jgi:hypothetical protein